MLLWIIQGNNPGVVALRHVPRSVDPCILAGSREGDTVLDPFNGSGTTGVVSVRRQRHYIGCELNADYIAMARERIGNVAPMFAQEFDGPAERRAQRTRP
jgi:DNA modification methylase